MSDLGIALAGGAIGTTLTAALAQVGRIVAAWTEVSVHDVKASERNTQLVVWSDDETQKLARELTEVDDDHGARGTLGSSLHAADLANRKAGLLHRYRDEEWRASLYLAQLRASERTRHRLLRLVRGRRDGLRLTAAETVQPFLERWREPVTRHGLHAKVFDRTQRTTDDAVDELLSLPLN